VSYTRAASLGDVSVGTAARHDAVLAHASLVASKIILAATRKPASIRRQFVANKLNAMRSGLDAEVSASRRKLIARGKNPDQATFDAMRLAIANVDMERGIQSLMTQAAVDQGVDALGTISPNDRAVGCTVASTASTVGGVASIVPVYGTIVGLVAGIGSGIASQALDCNRESREAQQQTAQAQANLQAAQQQAAMMQAAQSTQQQAARRRQLVTMGLLGAGAVVAVALVLWL